MTEHNVPMTETEWLSSIDPQAMLQHIEGKVSDRKLRLIACACSRQFWDELTYPKSQNAVELAEQYADGIVGLDELDNVWNYHRKFAARPADRLIEYVSVRKAAKAARYTLGISGDLVVSPNWIAERNFAAINKALTTLGTTQARIIRDVVGNPFTKVTFQDAWRSRPVLQLAQTVYEFGAYETRPILADALEEAGCVNESLLRHCRGEDRESRECEPCGGSGKTWLLWYKRTCKTCNGKGSIPCSYACVRGCWAIDLILGKE